MQNMEHCSWRAHRGRNSKRKEETHYMEDKVPLGGGQVVPREWVHQRGRRGGNPKCTREGFRSTCLEREEKGE